MFYNKCDVIYDFFYNKCDVIYEFFEACDVINDILAINVTLFMNDRFSSRPTPMVEFPPHGLTSVGKAEDSIQVSSLNISISDILTAQQIKKNTFHFFKLATFLE